MEMAYGYCDARKQNLFDGMRSRGISGVIAYNDVYRKRCSTVHRIAGEGDKTPVQAASEVVYGHLKPKRSRKKRKQPR